VHALPEALAGYLRIGYDLTRYDISRFGLMPVSASKLYNGWRVVLRDVELCLTAKGCVTKIKQQMCFDMRVPPNHPPTARDPQLCMTHTRA
jgi:hypothetical protein